ncbi:extracellular solute-binding protein [Paenibacillus sp.]|uniref:ABC transporter substrate-binding protein n=1 Tax=Paenibacillus sp. TaxID=58172 RepID=UPI0028A88C9C|nr:extracellular solute-binding protein [Paenibacillus sp.]
MKKCLSILMGLIIVLGLTACMGGNAKNNNNTGSGNKVTPGNTNPPSEQTGSIEDENKDTKKTIVISTLAVTDFYKEAKQKYEQKHPNVTVQFKEFETSATMSSAEVEKYIKTTTTEILSGKGADLFVMDIIPLPVEKYINKKAFVNLDDFIAMDSSFDPKLYQMNILENSKINDGLYVLPIQFYLQALFGDKNVIKNADVTIDDKNWTWSKFEEVGKQLAGHNNETYSLGNITPEEMLNYLVSDNYLQLVEGDNGTVNFESELFLDILKRVKRLYDDKILTAENKISHFNLSNIYSPQDYLGRLANFYEDSAIYQKPHAAGQKSGIAFGGQKNIAMNSNSTVKGTAWDFMKFLMSEEIQSIPQQDGFPIHKKVSNDMLDNLMKESSDGKIEDPKIGSVPISKEILEDLKKMINGASLPITLMNKVQTIIAEEAKTFFTGHKTAEDVAALIQNRVTTYMNE